MFEDQSCNMKPLDAVTRGFIASLLSISALYYDCYFLLLISFYLFYTAHTKFCYIYHWFNLNSRFSRQNYYLSFLPKFNPSEVFIFNDKGDVVFRNRSAINNLSSIKNVEAFEYRNYAKLIENGGVDSILHTLDKRCYKIELQGIQKEKLLLAYLTDVTEVMELNTAVEETQREVIYAMGEIGESRSKETGNHVKRVALYSKELATLYGLSEEEANLLKMASPMHDIGKVGIPDAILNAPRKLNADEFEVMKTHAELGYNMLKSSNKEILQAAAIVAYQHHEKFDGSGYPRGLKGEDIHIFGRITAIADVFDALGSSRVYKKAWELDRILTLFQNERAKHFDPQLIDLFMENLDTFLRIRDKYIDAS